MMLVCEILILPVLRFCVTIRAYIKKPFLLIKDVCKKIYICDSVERDRYEPSYIAFRFSAGIFFNFIFAFSIHSSKYFSTMSNEICLNCLFVFGCELTATVSSTTRLTHKTRNHVCNFIFHTRTRDAHGNTANTIAMTT